MNVLYHRNIIKILDIRMHAGQNHIIFIFE